VEGFRLKRSRTLASFWPHFSEQYFPSFVRGENSVLQTAHSRFGRTVRKGLSTPQLKQHFDLGIPHKSMLEILQQPKKFPKSCGGSIYAAPTPKKGMGVAPTMAWATENDL
jgi:hypothetical protein